MKKIVLLIVLCCVATLSQAQTYNYEQGVKAYQEADYEQALDYFSREIKDDPKSYMAYYYRSAIYQVQENYARALGDINNAIKYTPPKEKKVLVGELRMRADIYVKIENYEAALESYAGAVKLAPQDPDVYIGRAQIYFDLEQYDKAETDYKQALKIDESMEVAWAGLGRNYVNQEKYGEAEQTLNKLILLAPGYTAGYKFRAQLNYALERYNAAIDDAFRAFELDETDKGNRFLFIMYANKNLTLAVAKINARITAQPENGVWYFLRAQLNESRSMYSAAIIDYNKVMELSDLSHKPDLMSYRAKCYTNSGMYDKAISDYNEIITADSSGAYMFACRADNYRLKGDYQRAILDFTKAIEVDPEQSWFYYRRGWSYEFLNDFQKALSDYNDAIAVDPDYLYTYLNRGRLYEEHLKDPVRAKEDYTRILAMDTTADAQGNCRQYALFHLGRSKEAVEWLNKILQNHPNDGNYYDAACLYSLMNNTGEALANLEIAFTKGYRDFVHMGVDEDLNNIKNLPDFKALVQKWQKLADEEERKEEPALKDTGDTQEETVTIPMTPKGSGVYEVSCKVNDLRLNFIFDTGASDISISRTEAQFMLKNGYLNTTDIGGTQNYMDANGDIEVGTKITLRKVELGGLILKNVSASVINNKNAPLLFGQSALSKYGKIVIDNQKNTLTITRTK